MVHAAREAQTLSRLVAETDGLLALAERLGLLPPAKLQEYRERFEREIRPIARRKP